MSLTLNTPGTATLTASDLTHPGIVPGSTPSITVNKLAQTITCPPLTNRVYGTAPFTLSATASSGLPVTFNVVSGPATLAGNLLTLAGAGTVSVRASQAGNGQYNPAPQVQRGFQVNPAVLTVTAHNTNRLYGQTNPVFTGTIIGVQNGDDITAAYSSSATTNSPVGTYDIVPTPIDPDGKMANYTVILSNGVLCVVEVSRLVNITEGPEGTFVLEWQVHPGRVYQFQFKTNLLDLDWMTLVGDQTASMSSLTITNVAAPNFNGFYRALDLTVP